MICYIGEQSESGKALKAITPKRVGRLVNRRIDNEIEVFRDFVAAAGLEADLSTIKPRDPPEPDLTCELEGTGLVGFEITELIDQGHATRFSSIFPTSEALATYWQKELSAEERCEFKRKYSDAGIFVNFKQELTLRQRKAALRELFEQLLRLPDAASGVVLEDDSSLNGVIDYVSIHRGIVGPTFDTPSYGWLGDPTYARIKKKLKHQYSGSYPKHLICYVDINLLPTDVWKEEARRACELLINSDFTRVWVFFRTSQSIEFDSDFVEPLPQGQSTV